MFLKSVWHGNQLTRRDCARLLLASPLTPLLAAAKGPVQAGVGNEAMQYRFSLESGSLKSKTIVNRLTNEEVRLPVLDFTLEFEGGVTLTSLQCEVQAAQSSPGQLTFNYRSPEGIEVKVLYEAPSGKAYIRKRVSISSATSRRLFRAELENWDGVKRTWTSSTADKLPYGSHPIHCDTLWAGVEFPAAFNRYDSSGFVLTSRPGGRRIGADAFPLRSSVVGVCTPGEARPAFLRYIEDIRHAPPRMMSCYNSWWTTPIAIKRQDVVQLMSDLKKGFYDNTGSFFDIVTTDAGWSDPQSIWQIDSKNMPSGFSDVKAMIEPLGAKMGLWISPSEIYSPIVNWDWARKAGYAMIEPFPNQRNHGISLADPRYRSQTVDQLKELIGKDDFYQIKYDGFIASEVTPHHDLLPREDSVEPLADHVLELMAVSYKTRPDLVTEPTFWNSWANYISPWVIAYGDSVWANAGGDCPLGVGPAPAYREAHTTAREYFVFSSMEEVWLPQNAVQYFDIIQCDAAEGFANHVAMAVGRGRFFLATYINPKYMRPEDWKVYAAFVNWAKQNQSLLKHTEALPSRVEVGEAYAYGHWEGKRGVVVVRNPSNESATYMLDLARSGAPKDLTGAVCYSIYPHRQGLKDGLSGLDTVVVPLEPWQTLYLEVLPSKDLKEPVVLGGRWFPSGGVNHAIASTGGAPAALLEPGGRKRPMQLARRSAPTMPGAVTRFASSILPGPEWLAEGNQSFPSVAFTLDCNLTIPDETAATLLILVEFPGLEHRPSNCKIVINGSEAKTELSSSSGHIGSSQAKPGSYWDKITQHQSHWTWHMAKVSPGASKVQVSGRTGHPDSRVGVWVWLDTDLARSAIPVQFTSGSAELPQLRDTIERHGFCLRRPVSGSL